jgi:hypothetical protein
VFSVTSAFIQQPVIRNFFRDIVDMGIDLVLESNDFDAPYREQSTGKSEPAARKSGPAHEKPEPVLEKPAPAGAEAENPAGKEAP